MATELRTIHSIGDNSDIQVEFLNKIPETSVCLMCSRVSLVIYRGSCAHGICPKCHDDVSDTTIPCKVDNIRIAVNDMWEDCSSREAIMDLAIKCQYSHEGCTFTDKLSKLVDHLPRCVHVGAKCSWCQRTVPKKSLVVHMESLCEYRLINCQHCQDDFVASALQLHLVSCPKRPVYCEFCNEGNILNRDLVNHHSVCTMRPQPCKYKPLGCTYEALQDQLKDHETADKHLELIFNKFSNMENVLEEQQETIRNIQENGTANSCQEDLMNDILNTQNSLETRIQRIEDELQTLKSFMELIKEPMESLVAKLN